MWKFCLSASLSGNHTPGRVSDKANSLFSMMHHAVLYSHLVNTSADIDIVHRAVVWLAPNNNANPCKWLCRYVYHHGTNITSLLPWYYYECTARV